MSKKFSNYNETSDSWMSFVQYVTMCFAEKVEIKGHHGMNKTFKIDCLVLGMFQTHEDKVLDQKEVLAKFQFVACEALINDDHYELIVRVDDNKTVDVKIYSQVTDLKMFLVGLAKLEAGSYKVEERDGRMIAMQEIVLC